MKNARKTCRDENKTLGSMAARARLITKAGALPLRYRVAADLVAANPGLAAMTYGAWKATR